MSDTTDATSTTDDATAGQGTGAGQELGDGGKKALDAEREARRTAEKTARDAEQRAATLEAAETRRKVAADKGLTDAQAKFLAGDDPEAMAAHADELLAAFTPEPHKPGARTRPKEKLTGGASGADEGADVGAVADDVMRGW